MKKGCKNSSGYRKEPEVGEYFGAIIKIKHLEPFYSNGILYKTVNCDDYVYQFPSLYQFPLLFKRIDEDTIVDVLTGIPFVFGPSYKHYKDAAKQQEQFQKYRKIGLCFVPVTYFFEGEPIVTRFDSPEDKYLIPIDEILKGNQVYLKADEKFKMLYSEEMGKGLKEQLKIYAAGAHKRFDYALTETINTAHGIASVDNAIYDMEKKHKVKSLTKPNDDQK